MKVLVTGGAGFIGSHVVDALAAAGHEPRVFDLRPSPHHAAGSVDTAIGNILDPEELRLAMEGCDAVAHLAAAADVGEVKDHPAEAEALNARGTLNVLEAARAAEVKRVIYASTIWVYGGSEKPRVDEDTLLGSPDHLYTATKLSGEMYCRSYTELYGLDCTILRFGIPYGPRARPAAVIPAFVNKALAGEPLTIAGTGDQHRRFVYVEDLADGVARALRPEAANRTYNLVGDEDVSIRHVAHAVRDLVGDVKVVHTEGRTGDFAGVEVSGERAAAELGWRPATRFDEGLRRYLEWRREDVLPAASPTPAELSPAPASRLGWRRALAPRLASAWAVTGMALATMGLLGAYLLALYAEAGEDTTRTVLTVVFVVVATGTMTTRRRQRRWAPPALGWAMAIAGALAIALPWPRHVLDLARPDMALALLGIGGVGCAMALLAGGRRIALERERREQPQDSGF